MAKSKWGKTILGLAAVGGAVAAGALYLSKKNKCEECDDLDMDFEDEDFDLDSDLKPASDRGYVSLTPSADDTEDVVEDIKDAVEDVVEDIEDAVEDIVEKVTEE